jgi:pilus assembly protein Flp/PilA
MLYFLLNLLPKDEKGQDLSEYAMLIGLIALFVVTAVTLLGGSLDTVFTAIAGQVGPWVPAAAP